MKKILLAEDDVDDQEIFKEVVEQFDNNISLAIAENGEVLIKKIEAFSDSELPDLIVLDQNMPRLKGSDTIAALKQNDRYKDIPMVIYSTYHDTNFIRNCKQSGIDLYLKPDTFDDLKALLEKLVNSYIYR